MTTLFRPMGETRAINDGKSQKFIPAPTGDGYVPAAGSDPAVSFAAVTASDTVDLPVVCRALYIGGAGNLVAVSSAGDAVTFTAVQAGSILPVQAKRVNATGTTATNIVALY
jgi:hypothetical protein